MTIEKAFILGAGLGTRLRPLTEVLPKPLVPMWNEPLVYHALRHCKKAGIKQFAINTHHLPECWDKAFPQSHFEGCPIEFFHEPELLETGGGIKNIASFIDNNPILVFNGDIICDIDLTGLIEQHTRSSNLATLAVQSTGPACNIALQGDQVVDLRHSRGIHPSTHQFTGIYCLSPEVLELIPANQKISIIPAFLELAKCGQLGAFNADHASWIDIGTIETYRQAHAEHANSNTNGSFIAKDSHVGQNCKIKNSIVWPGCTIESDSQLTDCIVYSSKTVSGSHHRALL